MKSLYSLWRLCWRPQSLLLLLVVVPAAAWPLSELEQLVDAPLSAVWRGEPAGPVRAALWHMLLLVPLVPGIVVAWARMELQLLSGIGWTLPDLRRRLAVGTLVTGVVVAAVPAVLLVRADAGASALAGFACALAWFLLPGAAVDIATPRAGRWAALAALLTGLSWPGTVERMANASVLLATTLALAAVVAMTWLLVAPAPARRRPGHSWVPGELPAWLDWLGPGYTEWRTPLAGGRFLPWMQAAAHERGSVVFTHLFQATIPAVMTHVLGNPAMLLVFAGLGFLSDGTLLGDTLLHPVSRTRRADVAWAGTVLDAAVFCALSAIVLLVIAPLPQPFADDDLWRRSASLPVTLGLIFALAPFPRWGVILWGRTNAARASSLAPKRFVMLIPYVVAGALAIGTAGSGLLGDAASAPARVGLLALAAYAVHWLLLRRYYRAGDLTHA
ncbi:MAG TPA: hypothetical protein VK928_13300 [Longimicrobiales bacterium]|nr:hypothetical protein [Longimicrobiales bacterium]